MQKKKSLGKILLSVIALFVIALGLLVALLPSLISSSWGTNKILGYINNEIPGRLNLKELSISWSGPQTIKDVSLTDKDGNEVVTLQSGSLDSSLFALIRKRTLSGDFNIDSLNVNLMTDESGITNLQRALDKQCCVIPANTPSAPTISLKNVNAVVNIDNDNNQPLTIKASGDTQQGTLVGSFTVDGMVAGITLDQITNTHEAPTDLLKNNPNAEIKINANISNFPVAIIDQLSSLKNPERAGMITEIIGPVLNAAIDHRLAAEGLTLSIQANSTNLSADADLLIGKVISLANPAKLSLTINPKVLQRHLGNKWNLKSDIKCNVMIDKAQIPLSLFDKPFDKMDLTPVALNATIDLDPFSVVEQSKKLNLDLTKFHTLIQTDYDEDVVHVEVNAIATQNGAPMKADFKTTLPKTANINDLLPQWLKKIEMQGKLSRIPLAVIDDFAGLNGMLVTGIGSWLDVSIDTRPNGGSPLATLSLKSDKLELPNLTLVFENSISLIQPATAIITLDPTILAQIAPQAPIMTRPAHGVLKLHSLNMPIPEHNTALNFDNINAIADISLTDVALRNVPNVGELNVQELKVNVDATPLSKPQLKIKTKVSQNSLGFIKNVLGDQLTIEIAGTLNLEEGKDPSISHLGVLIDSNLLHASMKAELRNGDRLFIKSPTVIDYTLTTAGLQSLGINTDNYILTHEKPLQFTINSSHIPLSFDDISLLHIGGNVKINDLSLSSTLSTPYTTAELQDLNAKWTIDGSTRTIALDFDGITHLAPQEAAGKIAGIVRIDGWISNGTIDFSKAKLTADTKAQKLPTELIGALINQRELISLVGPSLDAALIADIALKDTPAGSISLNLRSERLSGTAHFALDKILSINHNKGPANFRAELTPNGYAALRRMLHPEKPSNFSLTEPCPITLSIQELNIPLAKSHAEQNLLLQSTFTVDVSIDKLAGMDRRNQKKMSLENIKGQIASSDMKKQIRFGLNATGKADSQQGPLLAMSGTLDNGFLNDGSLNKENLSFSFEGNIQELPIPLLCLMICEDSSASQKMEAIIGPTLNAKINAKLNKMNGPVLVDLKGKNGNVYLDGNVSQGIFRLNKDLEAQIQVTPQLGEYVLKEYLPVIGGLVSAEQPIRLKISPKGFALSLNDPSIQTTTIGLATLDMGKVRFSNDSQMSKVLGLLVSVSSDSFGVWLTPTYISFNNGVVKMERVDMLISDNFPVAAWGTVDLVKEKVNMVIGITGAAMHNAFRVPGIPKSYILQLPLKGPLNNPSIDKTKAAARISSIVAQTNGGPQGMVLGKVLDLASGGLSEGPPPEPTTRPLPWANMLVDPPETSGDAPQTVKKALEPIDEIGKGATNLIKNLFKK